MLEFLSRYAVTAALTLILIAAFVFIIIKIKNNGKKGSCGYCRGCQNCLRADSCAAQKSEESHKIKKN